MNKTGMQHKQRSLPLSDNSEEMGREVHTVRTSRRRVWSQNGLRKPSYHSIQASSGTKCQRNRPPQTGGNCLVILPAVLPLQTAMPRADQTAFWSPGRPVTKRVLPPGQPGDPGAGCLSA
ncbi:hypothetical protein BaRGS_00026894 [Batillaria attramentaria]|uniref:Uncharacterized protein n=1 Tax=Batillaria attramentaria TaxID=370345 RepID=A0ABD0K4H8_9CAEN